MQTAIFFRLPLILAPLVLLVVSCDVAEDTWDQIKREEWRIIHNEPQHNTMQVIGLGLTYTIEVSIRKVNSSTNDYALPNGFTVIVDDESRVEYRVLRTAEDDPYGYNSGPGGQSYLVQITPTALGPNRFRFLADNISETTSYSFSSVDIARVEIGALVNDRIRTSSFAAFVANPIKFSTKIFDANGLHLNGTPNHGAILLDGNPLPASLTPNTTGTHLISNTITADTLAFSIEDMSTMTGLAYDKKIHVTGFVPGHNKVVELFPGNASSKTIWGIAPEPYVLSVIGDAVKISHQDDRWFIMSALTPGNATISVSWGSQLIDIPVKVSFP